MSNNNGNSQTGARGLSGNGNVPGPNNVKTYNVPNSSKISTWTLSSPFLRRRSIPEKQLVALIQAYKSTNNKNANAKNAYMKLIKSEINKWGTGVPVAPVSVPRRSLRNVFRLRAAAPPAPAAAPANAPAAAPAAAPVNAHGPASNNRAPNSGNWPNGMYRLANVGGKLGAVYKVGETYYSLTGKNTNGKNLWAKVTRQGNSNKYNTNASSSYYVKNRGSNGRAVFVAKPLANANANAKKAAFQKFYTNFEPVGNMNWNTVISGIAGRGNTNNSISLRSFTKNNNNNRNSHANFWDAVNKLKAANAAAVPVPAPQ